MHAQDLVALRSSFPEPLFAGAERDPLAHPARWADTIVTVVEQTGHAAAVLDAARSLLASSAALARHDAVRLSNNRLKAACRRTDPLLQRAVDAALDTGAPPDGARLLLPAAAGCALIAQVGRLEVPLHPSGCLVVFTDIDGGRELDGAMLRQMFDLTPAEIRVVNGLFMGLSLRQIAARHGVLFNTVRCHLKTVLSKTGTHRQSELMALLGPLARMPAAAPGRNAGAADV